MLALVQLRAQAAEEVRVELDDAWIAAHKVKKGAFLGIFTPFGR